MKTPLKLSIIVLTSLLLSYQANAQLFSWVSQSDVICAAKVLSVKQMEMGTFPEPYGSPLKYYSAALQVEKYFKGSITNSTIDLELYQLDMDALRKQYPNGFGFSGWSPFYQLKTGDKYLFYVKKLPNQDRYYLTGLSDDDASILEYTNLSQQVQKDNSIFYNILIQLNSMIGEQELSTEIQPNRANALQLIGDYGSFLKVPDNQFQSFLYDNRDLLHKGDKEKIVLYLQASVIPQVKKLIQSQEPNIRKWAMFAAASLQVVDSLPQIITEAEKGGDEQGFYINLLALYGIPKATPYLIPLLKSPNQEIEIRTINALRNSLDRRSLPFLVDALKSSDFNVRKSAIISLLVITKENLGANSPRVVSSKTEGVYLSFWKKWAQMHKIELAKLRAEI